MGWLGDRLGQRKMLTRIVACWSGIHRAHCTGGGYLATSVGYDSLLVQRKLAHFLPWLAALATLVSCHRSCEGYRHNVDGYAPGSSYWNPLAALLIGWLGWRFTFAVFGAIGGCWCVFFGAGIGMTQPPPCD